MHSASFSRRAGLALIGVFVLTGQWHVLAHDPGLSTGQLRVFPGHLEFELTLAQADVEALMTLDADGDGEVSSSEWNSAQPSLNRLAMETLTILTTDQPGLASSASVGRDGSNNVHFTGTFPTRPQGPLTLCSDLLSRLPRGHRQFFTVIGTTGEVLSEALLSAGQATVTVVGGAVARGSNRSGEAREQGALPASTFAGFLTLGLEHIITGFDHLLFLFALLLMAPGIRQAAGIITSFTVAHSITLGLATLDVVHLSPRFVEPLIAATIIYVGIENLIRRDGLRGRWILTFAFGLVHGFGFASVLHEMGVSSGSTGLATPLLAFNLGVEIGQLAIAAAVLPILWQVRRTPVFVRYMMPACSALVVTLGSWWFLTRTLL